MTNEPRWASEYQMEWDGPTKAEKAASDAVQEYLQITDSFDRLFCGQDGVPKTAMERRAITRNALATRREVCAKYGISKDEFQKEIVRHNRER